MIFCKFNVILTFVLEVITQVKLQFKTTVKCGYKHIGKVVSKSKTEEEIAQVVRPWQKFYLTLSVYVRKDRMPHLGKP